MSSRSPKRKSSSSSGKTRKSSPRFANTYKNVSCRNNRTVKKIKKVPLNLQVFIDSKLKTFDPNDDTTGFGAELQKVKKSVTPETNIPKIYLSAPTEKLCYQILGNSRYDYNGDDLEPLVYATHKKYCHALYPDEFFTRYDLCSAGNTEDILPGEYNPITQSELQTIKGTGDENCKIFIGIPYWDIYKYSFTSSELKNYIENVELYLSNPYIDPISGKEWKREDSEKETDITKLKSFKRFTNLAYPYINALNNQYEEITLKSKPYVKNEEDANLDPQQLLNKIKDWNSNVTNYLENSKSKVCKKSAEYEKICKKVGLYLLYTQLISLD